MSEKEGQAVSTNPYTGEIVNKFNYLTEDEISKKIQQSWDTFLEYRNTGSKVRAERLYKLADVLEKNLDKFAKCLTTEMGKPIKEAKGEVQKCAKHCRHFAEHIDEYLRPEDCASDAKKSYVIYQPLGPIFHITPFNFPLWLIFKGCIPCLAMGNTVLNKNPRSCSLIGIMAESAFREAGWGNGEFINLVVSQQHTEFIISNSIIRGVSFTGSTGGGSDIASLAGKHCKKAVMELGGNDPFLVLKDADMDLAVEQSVLSRLKNGGQVCTSAKRFIIDESIYDDYLKKLVDKVKEMKIGNPMNEDTQIGPLAKKDGLEKTIDQVKRAVENGAKLVYGGEQMRDGMFKNGFFYMPTILEVEEGNPILKEETFGPIFSLLKFKNEEDAIRIANDTKYGLASAILSKDEERAQKLGLEIDTGSVFVNHMVESNSTLPSGGVKASGFGREGGKYGAHEFVNVKSIYIGQT
jgi:succinate-semialdehyde dehydrogenase/glutarate-semialdehyde dehydrogenase